MADTRVHRADRGDHPRLTVLPGPAGPGGTKVAHRHPPGPARPVALPGPVRLGPVGHQRRRAHRGGHLRRRRGPLRQRLRLRRARTWRRTQLLRVQPATARTAHIGPNGPRRRRRRRASRSQEAGVHAIASSVGATDVVELDNPAVSLQNPSGSGRQWDGPIYVATPALLRAYGINPSSIPSNVDILSSRPGLAGSGVQLTYGGGGGKGGGVLVGPGAVGWRLGPGPGNTNTCSPGSCLAHPVDPAGEPAAHRHRRRRTR